MWTSAWRRMEGGCLLVRSGGVWLRLLRDACLGQQATDLLVEFRVGCLFSVLLFDGVLGWRARAGVLWLFLVIFLPPCNPHCFPESHVFIRVMYSSLSLSSRTGPSCGAVCSIHASKRNQDALLLQSQSLWRGASLTCQLQPSPVHCSQPAERQAE